MIERNVYQRINAVMSECDYLQKKQVQQGKGIKYDEVMAMIRQLLIKHGLVMVTRQSSLECLAGVEGTKQKIYQGEFFLDIVNMDNPSEIVTHSCFAQGMDGGDKGAGKAHTYAMKTMLVKGFGIETGDDEESRSEKLDKQNTISKEQIDQLYPLCVTKDAQGQLAWSKLGKTILKAYAISDVQQLPASKFNEVMKMAMT